MFPLFFVLYYFCYNFSVFIVPLQLFLFRIHFDVCTTVGSMFDFGNVWLHLYNYSGFFIPRCAHASIVIDHDHDLEQQ